MNLTIPDPLWERICKAFANTSGPLPVVKHEERAKDGTVISPAVLMTPDEFARLKTMEFFKNTVKAYEGGIALQPTQKQINDAHTSVEADFPKSA